MRVLLLTVLVCALAASVHPVKGSSVAVIDQDAGLESGLDLAKKNATWTALDGDRAKFYLGHAEKLIRKLRKFIKSNADADLFNYFWATVNQLYAAVEFAPANPAVLAKAVKLGLSVIVLSDEESGGLLPAKQLATWATASLTMNPKQDDLIQFMQKISKSKRIEPSERKQLSKAVKEMKSISSGSKSKAIVTNPQGTPATFDMSGQTFTPPLRVSNIVPNPKPTTQSCVGGSCEALDASANLHLETHELWPSRISTLHLSLPSTFFNRISELAIAKYKQVTSERKPKGDTLEGINNYFFQHQPKATKEVRGKFAYKWWPELYRDSKEYKLLRDVAKAACIEHAMRNGRPQKREELEKMRLVLWAAVYIDGTPHSTHVHEQSVCSGAFYSRMPPGTRTPIIFSDPRGTPPLWIDSSKAERQPQAPFHHQYTFFPNEGDMVLFPSYLPHRIPPHNSNNARVTWAFNLEGGVDTWARMNV